ncbi:MAG: DUF177 domain-containing protein, partial [Clostridia bacterium]|nr:DUF177 domain-containing protein [Clostridia bacterium]
ADRHLALLHGLEKRALHLRRRAEDNDEILLYADDKLELDEVVTDLTALNMDMRPMCSPDCKGVCFGCGANLNDGPCTCESHVSE